MLRNSKCSMTRRAQQTLAYLVHPSFSGDFIETLIQSPRMINCGGGGHD